MNLDLDCETKVTWRGKGTQSYSSVGFLTCLNTRGMVILSGKNLTSKVVKRYSKSITIQGVWRRNIAIPIRIFSGSENF